MAERENRQSNIELLRIAAALGVMLLHYNNAKLGGGFAAVKIGSINEMLMTLIEVAAICAVNVYVLITGYFMRDSLKRDLLKPLKLVAQLIVFGFLFYFIKEIPKGAVFSPEGFLGYFAPSYWFVFVYISLYIVSPYINFVWTHLDEKGKKILLLLCIGLFSVYPMIVEIIGSLSSLNMRGMSTVGIDGAQKGYTIVNFVLMYLIGCYIRDKEESGINIEKSEICVLLALNIAVLFAWTYMDRAVTGNSIVLTTAWNYENPAVICEAVLVFLLFRKMDIKKSKAINTLAAASFPAYLIHLNFFEYCAIPEYAAKEPWVMLLHMALCVTAMYIASFFIYSLYDLIFGRIFAFVSKHWVNNRKYSV